MDYKIHQLKNGLKIVTTEMPNALTISIAIHLKMGARYENKHNKGISHFLEHMAFKGSKKFPNSKIVSETIEGMGGKVNAFTDKEMICFFTSLPHYNFQNGLEVISDIIQNPILSENEINKEKRVVLEEINMYQDFPDSLVYKAFWEIMWPNHPLGWDVLGDPSIIRKVKRQDFIDYIKKFYSTDRMVISIAGKGKTEEWVKKSKEIWSSYIQKATLNPLPFESKAKLSKVKLLSKKTDQTHIILGVEALTRKSSVKETLTGTVLDAVLAGGMSSRLHLRIRDKLGIAYAINTYSARYAETGVWMVYTGLNSKRVDEGIKAILEEFENLKNHLVVQKELKRAKEFAKGELIMRNESSSVLSFWYGDQAAFDHEVITIQEAIKEIDKVTSKDIQELAIKILNYPKLAVIGPFKDETKFAKILGL